jgi:hypothetical protein
MPGGSGLVSRATKPVGAGGEVMRGERVDRDGAKVDACRFKCMVNQKFSQERRMEINSRASPSGRPSSDNLKA